MFDTSSLKLKRIIGNSAKESLEHFYLYSLKLNDIAVNLYVSKKRLRNGRAFTAQKAAM